jgi:two-component system, NtrC family, nitrogen regulation sensor histidine kinase NtrY
MLFKRFNILVILRLAFLIGNVILISSILGDKRLFFNQIILMLILVFQIIDLVRFVNHTNRELTRFFLAIRHSDFSITFKKGDLGKSFRDLHQSMSDLIDAYTQVKIQKEAQFHFLQMLVSKLNIGLIALEDERITLMNPTAETLLGVEGAKNWKMLTHLNVSFVKEIEAMGENGRKLLELRSGTEARFLTVDVSTLLILGKAAKLITFQDINPEIEQKEIEAWHKLIRILTHEIMNSVTPISSLTETMQGLLEDRDGNQKQFPDITNENIKDVRFALGTIQKRSDGLLHFIENYRKLTRVPKPKIETITLGRFFAYVENLMTPKLSEKGIRLNVTGGQDLSVQADPVLLEQVVINLLTNSIHALENKRDPVITITGYRESHFVILEIRDNGRGIAPRVITEIFTPFFSTRKDGSGIGLSLSKQIMSMHGGSIRVRSEVGVGTSMLLYFKEK